MSSRSSAVRVLLLALAGCALAASGCASSGPAPLLEEANLALEAGDLARAYSRVKEIRTRHPASREAGEAFPLAARNFRQLWWSRRMEDQLDSPWVRSEQAFMFDWLASYCDAEDFPEARMVNLFRGMPAFFFRNLLAYAESDAEASQWEIAWEEDNGRMVSITGRRRNPPPGGTEEGEDGSAWLEGTPESYWRPAVAPTDPGGRSSISEEAGAPDLPQRGP
jgi:hypothetical protein